MTARGSRIACRIIFGICGLGSLFTAVPYALLRGVDLPVESEWVVFVIALGLVGVFSLTVAFLPQRWIAKASRRECEDRKLFFVPLKLLGGFAMVSYAIAVFGYLAPHTWNVNAQLMLALCPMYVVKMTFDPSPMAVFFLLAPMNAVVFGALGVTLGYFWLFVSARIRA